jgi:hypothetical protein
MSFTQLEPPFPLHVVDRGKGMAVAVIDYGPEFDLLWVTAMDDGGEIWCVPNAQVRMQANWSMGRRPQAAAPKASPKIAQFPAA